MRTLIASIGFALAVVMLQGPAAAQSGAVVGSSSPGTASVAKTARITATITAIDPASREVTLKGPQGKEVTVVAGPDVKNFAQLKVGDEVMMEYVEALTLELKKGSDAPVSRSDKAGAAGAKPGDSPAGVGARQVTVTAEVMDLDPKTQTVTLRGPQRTVELKVADPEQFKLIAKGDRVEATYTQALAVAVEPAKK